MTRNLIMTEALNNKKYLYLVFSKLRCLDYPGSEPIAVVVGHSAAGLSPSTLMLPVQTKVAAADSDLVLGYIYTTWPPATKMFNQYTLVLSKSRRKYVIIRQKRHMCCPARLTAAATDYAAKINSSPAVFLLILFVKNSYRKNTDRQHIILFALTAVISVF